jgi:hypothetical protein
LEGLKKLHPVPGLRIVRPPKGRGKDPVRVVRQAVLRRTSAAGSYDQVWCVIDKDEFDLGVAVAEAAGEDIQLAVSVPSFEFWLLLHHKDCGAPLSPKQALDRLRQQVPAYDKARLNFGDFANGLDAATGRARQLTTEGPVGDNPSSGMWRLVDTIMREARA